MATFERTRGPFGAGGEEGSGAARADLGHRQAGAPWRDLSLPVVSAMLDRFPEATDEEIAELVEAMLGIEEAELAPPRGDPPGPG